MYIKKEILQSQLDCMIKNNKPQNHIDSHKRTIKRQNKKILGYEERINNKKQQIEEKYNSYIKKLMEL